MATTFSALAEEEKKKVNQIFNKQKEQINANANASIADAERSYDEQQRAIAVQKLINERKVAESMANLGLTDSGLNRTQQTAIQLSAANAGYNLNRQKQQAIDKIKLQRDNDISTVEQKRLASDIDIDNTYASMEANAVAAAKNAGIISRDNAMLNLNAYTGSLEASGVSVVRNGDGTTTYIDRNTGYSSTFDSKINPYTNTKNPDTEFGVWENGTGYQPNNINRTPLKKVDTFDNKKRGLTQNIFEYKASNGAIMHFIWDEGLNEYVRIAKENGKWVSTGESVSELKEAKKL